MAITGAKYNSKKRAVILTCRPVPLTHITLSLMVILSFILRSQGQCTLKAVDYIFTDLSVDRSNVFFWENEQTDRQTDTQTDGQTHRCNCKPYSHQSGCDYYCTGWSAYRPILALETHKITYLLTISRPLLYLYLQLQVAQFTCKNNLGLGIGQGQ